MTIRAWLTETWARWSKWASGWMRGGPHFVVGPPGRPYLNRWYVIPRNDWLCVYLHQFLRDDDDRALHDHPWASVSFLLGGRYVEQTFSGAADPITGERPTARREYRAGSVIVRKADHAHRIELPDGKPAWTLFITGPRIREWGFHCPRGWVHWKLFTGPTDVGQTGKGCDQ